MGSGWTGCTSGFLPLEKSVPMRLIQMVQSAGCDLAHTAYDDGWGNHQPVTATRLGDDTFQSWNHPTSLICFWIEASLFILSSKGCPCCSGVDLKNCSLLLPHWQLWGYKAFYILMHINLSVDWAVFLWWQFYPLSLYYSYKDIVCSKNNSRLESQMIKRKIALIKKYFKEPALIFLQQN